MLEKKVNRKIFEIHNLGDDLKDRQYWLNQSANTRMAAIEIVRRINYGENISSERLSIFFEVAEFKQS